MDRGKSISTLTQVKVRFSEVDSLGMVWHGNYIKYLEDGREAFGREHGLEYLGIYARGYITPVFEMTVQYKKPARVNDILCVETTYRPVRGAKMVYEYKVTDTRDGSLIMLARSLQLYQTVDGQLEVSKPEFVREWEKNKGL